jgi:hypothetical protein
MGAVRILRCGTSTSTATLVPLFGSSGTAAKINCSVCALELINRCAEDSEG